jgi:hypothetical protein
MKNGTQRNLGCISFFGVARKRELMLIAIGELHVGVAWDIRVILFSKKILPNIS